jgi:hypothetical protein
MATARNALIPIVIPLVLLPQGTNRICHNTKSPHTHNIIYPVSTYSLCISIHAENDCFCTNELQILGLEPNIKKLYIFVMLLFYILPGIKM